MECGLLRTFSHKLWSILDHFLIVLFPWRCICHITKKNHTLRRKIAVLVILSSVFGSPASTRLKIVITFHS
jgi:hypothetical protein